MAKVIPGRFTAQTDESFVVFLIGMRVNKFFALNKWLPVASSMGPMLRTLYTNPKKDFLSGETSVYWPGVMLVQYWRSFDDLERFARSPKEPHLSAWRRFNKAVGTDGSVGIWHETFMIEPGRYEAVYNNMPVYGLAAATSHVPAVDQRETARRRIGGKNEPAVPSPEPPR